MRRLSGEDSQFVFQESHTQPLHTMKVVVVDPAGAHRELTFDRFREGIREVIPHTAPFRRQLVEVPFHLGHPYWVDDPDLDIDYHVRRVTAPAPGGRRELAEIISLIAGTRLERNRPLWQAWLVDGLEHGHVAFVMKVHHSLADGLASAQLLLDMLSPTPDPLPDPAPLEDLPRESRPSRAKLQRRAFRDNAVQLRRLPRLTRSALRWLLANTRQRLRRERSITKPFTVPRMRWNAPLTASRWFAYDTISLPAMKRVKDAHGATVNDVFLAVVAGGCRRYLDRHGELPEVDLSATIPVATRPPEEAREWGNRMTSWMIELGTSIDDPVERLRTISARAAAARRAREERGVHLQREMMEAWPIFVLATRWFPAVRKRWGRNATFSLIASNVPGPRHPLFVDGARVTEVISMGPLVRDLGLNFTGWSYCDDFTIGVVACREHVPDLWDLMDDTVAAFEELVALTPDPPGRTPP